jgi:hypothetical protein
VEEAGAEDQASYDDRGLVAGSSTSPEVCHGGKPGEAHQEQEGHRGTPGRGDYAFPATRRRTKLGEHDIRALTSFFIASNLDEHQ